MDARYFYVALSALKRKTILFNSPMEIPNSNMKIMNIKIKGNSETEISICYNGDWFQLPSKNSAFISFEDVEKKSSQQEVI